MERGLVDLADLELWFDAERSERLGEDTHGVLDFVLRGGAAIAGLASAHQPLPHDGERPDDTTGSVGRGR